MKLTIFTPTYNRTKYLLPLFESIVFSYSRSDKTGQIEWLIVDDGSEEDVKTIVDGFKAVNGIDIKYIYKNNGGKHTAFNVALNNATGDYFVCIDDDDPLTQNAIPDIFKYMKSFQSKGYAGIVGRVVDKKGHLLGRNLFSQYLISNTIEIRDKYHFWGEPEVYYTEVIAKHRFPEFRNEKFLTEAYMFDEITTKMPLVYTNVPMQVKQYMRGGLTDNQLKIRIESPKGCESYYFNRSKLCKGFKYKLKAIINRQRFSYWITGSCIKRKVNVYEVIGRPISLLMYIKDKLEYKRDR